MYIPPHDKEKADFIILIVVKAQNILFGEECGHIFVSLNSFIVYSLIVHIQINSETILNVIDVRNELLRVQSVLHT